MDYPKRIPVNSLFNIEFSSAVNANEATVTWNLSIPIDLNAHLKGKSLIECIPECFPDISSQAVLDYLGSVDVPF